MRFFIRKFDKTLWHTWFAWYPVCVMVHDDGEKEYVWLYRVLRRFKPVEVWKDDYTDTEWIPEYKEI